LALVAQHAVEGLDVGVVDGLTGKDEYELDAAVMSPGIERPAAELGAVVHDDLSRQSALFGEPLEYADDASAAQTEVELECGTLPRAGIDDRQNTKRSVPAHRVAHEVHRPAFDRSKGWNGWHPRNRDALASTTPHRETLEAIQTADTLVVISPALLAKLPDKHGAPPARILRRELALPRA
jgi:hypothetical protein